VKKELPREKHWAEGNLSVPYPDSCGDFDPIRGKRCLLSYTRAETLLLPRWENTPFGKKGCNVFVWITGSLKSPNYNQTLYAQTVWTVLDPRG